MSMLSNRAHRNAIAAVALIVIAVIVSSLFMAFAPYERVRRLYWFPDTVNNGVRAEWHLQPRRADLRQAVGLYVSEFALGPTSVRSQPLFGPATRVTSSIVNDGTAYVNLSWHAGFGIDGDETIVDDALALIERGVLHNFHTIDDVVITIEGQIPRTPRFAPSGR